jgi:hypothetical protein
MAKVTRQEHPKILETTFQKRNGIMSKSKTRTYYSEVPDNLGHNQTKRHLNTQLRRIRNIGLLSYNISRLSSSVLVKSGKDPSQRSTRIGVEEYLCA